MKTVSLALLTFWLAQAPTLTLAPAFQEGESLHLEIKRTRDDSARPSIGGPVTSVDLRVVKAQPEEILIGWVFGKTRVETVREPTVPAVRLSTDYEGICVEIVLRRDGTFRIQNSEEVLSRIRVATDSMVEKALQAFPQDQRKQIEDSIRRLVTPELQRDMIMRDVWLFFAFYGLEVQAGTTSEKALIVPYRLSTGDIRSRIRAGLADLEPGPGIAHIRIENVYPPTAIEEIASDAMTQSRYFPAPGKPTASNVTETVNITFRPAEGYIEEIVQELVITHDDFRRVDRTEISVAPKVSRE